MSHHTFQKSSRRDALKLLAGSVCCWAIAPPGAFAATDLPHLTDANPSAASLGYTEDSNAVDNRKFPKHQTAQHCASCRFFQSGSTAQYAPCQLYPGNVVNANGWCAGFVSK